MYNKLKGARAEKGISQVEMAKHLGITPNAYSLKEKRKKVNGKDERDFTISEAKTILKVLGKKFEDIFF